VRGLLNNDAMRVFILHIILALCFQVQLGAQEWQWAKTFNGYSGISTLFAIPGINGDIIIGGSFSEDTLEMDGEILKNNGEYDVFIASLDASKKMKWLSGIGGLSYEDLSSMKVDNNGNIFAIGFFSGQSLSYGTDTIINLGDQNVFLAKMDDEGQPLWIKPFGGKGNTSVFGLELDDDGNAYIGVIEYADDQSIEVYIYKISDGGDILWQKKSIGTNTVISLSEIKICKNEKRIYIPGTVYETSYSFDDGVVIENNKEMFSFNLSYDLEGQQPNIAFDENYYLTGIIDCFSDAKYLIGLQFNDPNTTTILIKQNKDNQVIWEKVLSEDSYDNFQYSGITATSTENIVISGTLFNGEFSYDGLSIKMKNIVSPSDTLAGYSQFFILEIDSQGNGKRLKGYEGFLYNSITRINKAENDEILISGLFQDSNIQLDEFSLKNDNRLDTIVGIHGEIFIYRMPNLFLASYATKTATSTFGNFNQAATILYPNPTNNTLYLQSDAFTGQPVQVQIFSTDGRLVRQQNISGAMQTIQIQTGDLPPGMYIATTIVNQQISSAKFVKQ
jgi:hypothetical protein